MAKYLKYNTYPQVTTTGIASIMKELEEYWLFFKQILTGNPLGNKIRTGEFLILCGFNVLFLSYSTQIMELNSGKFNSTLVKKLYNSNHMLNNIDTMKCISVMVNTKNIVG